MSAKASTATAPKPSHTKVRHIRVPDVIWEDAAVNAETEGMSISELVRDLLRDYNAGKRMAPVRARGKS